MTTKNHAEDLFGQLLALLNEEELIRLRRRAEKKHFEHLAEILGEEISFKSRQI